MWYSQDRQILETEIRFLIGFDWGGGEWNVPAKKQCWISSQDNKNILELDNSNSYTTLDVLETAEYVLKGCILWYINHV